MLQRLETAPVDAGFDDLPIVPDFKEARWIRLALLSADILAVALSLVLGYFTREFLGIWFPIDLSIEVYIGILCGVLVLPFAYYAIGLYPGYGLDEITRLRRRVCMTLLVFVGVSVVDYSFLHGEWSRGILFSTFLYTLLIPSFVERMLRDYFIRRKLWGMPVVIVGATSMGLNVARTLLKRPRFGLVPIGFVDDRSEAKGGRRQPIPILGSIVGSRELRPRVRLAVVALPSMHSAREARIYEDLAFPDILIVPSDWQVQSLWIRPQDMGGVLALRIRRDLLLKHNRLIKRTADISAACLIGLIAAPVVGVFAALIKMIDGGSVFYFQVRAGMGGKTFRMAKLRTMHVGADKILETCIQNDEEMRQEWQRYAKLRNDPRVLPIIGHVMRRWSIDELPQIWHVLIGEMSFIGPRPLPEYHLERFSEEFRRLRICVWPGITGLWQVEARSTGDLEAQEALDTFYIRNWSPWVDLYVILRTLPAILSGRGAW